MGQRDELAEGKVQTWNRSGSLCFIGRPCQERWRLRRVEGTVAPPAIPGWRTAVGPHLAHLPLQFLHPLAASEYHTSHTLLMFLFLPLLYNLNVKCFFSRRIKPSKIKRTKGRFYSVKDHLVGPGVNRPQGSPPLSSPWVPGPTVSTQPHLLPALVPKVAGRGCEHAHQCRTHCSPDQKRVIMVAGGGGGRGEGGCLAGRKQKTLHRRRIQQVFQGRFARI